MSFRIVCIVCLMGVLSCSGPPPLEVGSTEAGLSGSTVAYALADGLIAAEGHLGFTSVSGGAGDDGQLSVGVPIVVPPGVAGMRHRSPSPTTVPPAMVLWVLGGRCKD